MSDVFIIVKREAVTREYDREETTVFERQQDTVFTREDVVRVFKEVIPNGT